MNLHRLLSASARDRKNAFEDLIKAVKYNPDGRFLRPYSSEGRFRG